MTDAFPPDGLVPFIGTARFKIIRKLGSGGMGTVYEALDQAHDTRIAIKTFNLRDPEYLLRLKREFRSVQGRPPGLLRPRACTEPGEDGIHARSRDPRQLNARTSVLALS